MVNGATLKPASFCFNQMQQAVDHIQFVDDIERGYVRQVSSIPQGTCFTAVVHQPVLAQQQEKPQNAEKANNVQEVMRQAMAVKRESSQESLNTSVSSSSTASPSKQLGTPRKRRIAAKFSVPLEPSAAE